MLDWRPRRPNLYCTAEHCRESTPHILVIIGRKKYLYCVTGCGHRFEKIRTNLRTS